MIKKRLPSKSMLEAAATLIGAVIGAGVLGIPYIVASSGYLIGIATIIIVGLMIMAVNLYMGEVVLRTKGNHQLTGYAEKYLGKKGKVLMLISLLTGIYGALIAYIIASGESVKAIFGGSALLYSLIFFIFVASVIYIGIKSIEKWELIIVSSMIVVVILICLFAINSFSLENINFTSFKLSNYFVSYGVILFAFLGTAAIPEMKEELQHNRKALKRAILIGSITPLIIFIIFATVVIGAVSLDGFNSLPIDERIATIALGKVIGSFAAVLSNLFALFAVTTSFIAMGYALKEMYQYDYDKNKKLSWALACLAPLVIFLLDVFLIDITNFIKTLSIAGSISGGLAGILIIMMFKRAKLHGNRKPEFKIKYRPILAYIIMTIFFIGIVYEVYKLFL